MKKDLQREHIQSTLDECTGDTRATWKELNKLWPTKSKQNHIMQIDQDTDAAAMANLFNTHVATVDQRLKDALPPLNENEFGYVPNAAGLEIGLCSSADVYNLMKGLSNSNACGVDGITSRLLKSAGYSICHPLSFIFNLSISTNTFPSDWKTSIVVPLFKGGDRSDANNYRPISLLQVTSKLLERWVHDKLYTYLQNVNFFLNQQSGFRKGYSTVTCLIDFLDGIYLNIEDGVVSGVLLLDLKKAFDSVHHAYLLRKLGQQVCMIMPQIGLVHISAQNSREQRLMVLNLMDLQ